MAKMGKRIKAARANVDRNKVYSIAEAAKIVKANAKAKFDETIDISMNLGVDARHADQKVRGTVVQFGHFHSDYHHGIPYQLQKNHPDIKVAVITFASSVDELNDEDTSRLADFVWIGES